MWVNGEGQGWKIVEVFLLKKLCKVIILIFNDCSFKNAMVANLFFFKFPFQTCEKDEMCDDGEKNIFVADYGAFYLM